MGRSPCCVESGLKKGPWTQEEDDLLTAYIKKHGHGNWRILPKNAGLNRCGKSCRLRWINYLQPDIKRGKFSEEEEQMIIKLHSILGNKWSRIASHLPGRTDNEIKNYWNTHLRKKLLQMGIDPVTHRPRTDLTLLANLSQILSFPMSTPIMTNYPHDQINALTLQSNAAELVKLQVLHKIIQILQPTPNPSMDHSSALLPSQPNNNNNTKLPSPITPTKVFDAVAPSSSLSASVPATSDVEQCGGVFDSGGGSFSQGLIDANKYGNGILAENKLPGLVSASSTDQGLCVNENMPSNTNSIHEFMEYLPDLDFLDGWPNLIDDGTSELFWKDLLN